LGLLAFDVYLRRFGSIGCLFSVGALNIEDGCQLGEWRLAINLWLLSTALSRLFHEFDGFLRQNFFEMMKILL
jgi:hypothetical protein